ncbi:ankyrin repeat-containing domain protein [Mycena vulgaris]|nr:ankyrin repeat-containing domain protein [Mycena vulgaris]
MISFPCIMQADPDISGIGVRTAIYTQNLLSFILAIWALWDGEVSAYELESVETQSTTILITAFAILISAMVETRAGLSSFHASIVLTLSWMNNTNTFIYFLLYVQHKSQPQKGRVEMELFSWITHIWGQIWARTPLRRMGTDDREGQLLSGGDDRGAAKGGVANAEQSEGSARRKSPMGVFFRKIVLVLGSLHLSLMAALGIWLWSDPTSFGTADPCAADTVILSQLVPLGSSQLRSWSLGIDSLFLAPGLNLLLPAGLFLSIFLGYQELHRRANSSNPRLQPSIVPIIIGMVLLFAINIIFLVDIELTLRHTRASEESNWSFGQILALLLLVLPMRDLVETISERRETKRKAELARHEQQRKDQHTETLRRAIRETAKSEAILEYIERGTDVNTMVEEGWEYGTALQLACAQRDHEFVATLLDHGADPNICADKYTTSFFKKEQTQAGIMVRTKHRFRQHSVHIATIGRSSGLYPQSDMHILPRAAKDGQIEVCKQLLERGVDLEARGPDDATALQTASRQGHLEIVRLLLDEGADVNAEGGEHGPALQAAVRMGKLDVVRLLLDKGADVNAQGGKYGTAIQAASLMGHAVIAQLLVNKGVDAASTGRRSKRRVSVLAWDIPTRKLYRLLLDNGADVNALGGEYGTALQTASYTGNGWFTREDARLNMSFEGGSYGTALQATAFTGSEEMVRLLLEKGADVNAQAGEYGTALQAACAGRKLETVKLLLKREADVNAQGGYYGTALQAAACWGRETIVQLILEKGADSNGKGGRYGTALQAACVGPVLGNPHPEIVKLLLDNGADVNALGGEHGTALQAASHMGMVDIVQLLLERGADVAKEACMGRRSKQHMPIIIPKSWSCLLASGADPAL